jgi:hypothetical protein
MVESEERSPQSRKEIVIDAGTLLSRFWGVETSHDQALNYLNSPAFPGRPSRLEQIVGYLKPEKFEVVEWAGVIRFTFGEDEISKFLK